MSSNVELQQAEERTVLSGAKGPTQDPSALTAEEERRRRYRDFCEYQQGKRDGQEGLALSGLSEVYIEGYILGRKLAFRIVKSDR